MEMLNASLNPQLINGVYTFTLPLANGAMPLIHLDDLGLYALWIFTHPEDARGLNLEIATAHVTGEDMAAAFTAATGRPAAYQPDDIQTFLEKGFASMPQGPDTLIGVNHAPGDKTLLTWRQNFTAWWEIYRASGGNKGIIQRDYDLLDRILPSRVRSLEEWMKKVGYTGEYKRLLKATG
jgi:hypothetical protein